MRGLIAVCFLVVCAAIGVARMRRRARGLSASQVLAAEFLLKFQAYVQSAGTDTEAYAWLLMKTPGLQSRMGRLGIAQLYQPPGALHVFRNYEILVNELPALRERFLGGVPNRSTVKSASLIEESLLRYIGYLDDTIDEAQREARNPLVWMREGVGYVLSIPFRSLHSSGVISGSLLARLTEGPLWRAVADLTAAVGVVGAVVGLAVDWPAFVETVRRILASW